jgi:hypothetical protein
MCDTSIRSCRRKGDSKFLTYAGFLCLRTSMIVAAANRESFDASGFRSSVAISSTRCGYAVIMDGHRNS